MSGPNTRRSSLGARLLIRCGRGEWQASMEKRLRIVDACNDPQKDTAENEPVSKENEKRGVDK